LCDDGFIVRRRRKRTPIPIVDERLKEVLLRIDPEKLADALLIKEPLLSPTPRPAPSRRKKQDARPYLTLVPAIAPN
jgi:hypothetical protein